MSAPKIHVGIDVSKAFLDITYLETYIQKPNTTKGIQQIIAILKTLTSPVHLIVEATGGYEQALMEASWKAHLLVSRVDPRKVRHLQKIPSDRGINPLRKVTRWKRVRPRLFLCL
jgi:transposase